MPNEPTRQRVAYLPPRAAKARKLILRTRLGLPWMLAAILFGLVILAAGLLFLVKGGRPGAPWEALAPVARFADGAVTQAPAGGGVVVVDRRDGVLHAFAALAGPCPVQAAPAGFSRPCARQAWDADGAPLAAPGSPGSPGSPGTPPALRAVPVTVAKGDLYVDLSGAGLHPALRSTDGSRGRQGAGRAA